MTTTTLNHRGPMRLADHMADCADVLRIAVHQATAQPASWTAASGSRAACKRVCTWPVFVWLTWARSACCPALWPVRRVRRSRCAAMPRCGRAWPRSTPAGRCRSARSSAWSSGPMRAAYGKEEIFQLIPGRENPDVAVGVLEAGELPGVEVAAYLSEKLGLPPERLTLLVAPSTSVAGTIQVVARPLETAPA